VGEYRYGGLSIPLDVYLYLVSLFPLDIYLVSPLISLYLIPLSCHRQACLTVSRRRL
jgi:hypothetical protein